MRPHEELRDQLNRLSEIERAAKAHGRHLLLLEALAKVDPTTPKGIKEGIAESLKELRSDLAELQDLRSKLPKQFVAGVGGDA